MANKTMMMSMIICSRVLMNIYLFIYLMFTGITRV